MSIGAVMMVVAALLALGSLGFLLFIMLRSIRNERSSRGVLKDFGLSISLMVLFFTTWIGQGISQWQSFTDEQREHGQEPAVGDFFAEFSRATLENWQSEFLQLFAFAALSALLIHKGSAESKDSAEKIEASLRRLEEKLGTLPSDAPQKREESWKLPETPQKLAG